MFEKDQKTIGMGLKALRYIHNGVEQRRKDYALRLRPAFTRLVTNFELTLAATEPLSTRLKIRRQRANICLCRLPFIDQMIIWVEIVKNKDT